MEHELEPETAQQSQNKTTRMGDGQFQAVTPDKALEGEIVEPANPHESTIAPGRNTEESQPREGTLAWLRQQPHVDVNGRRLPAIHRLNLDEGSLLELDTDDGRCSYMRPNGQRCGAPRLVDYGLCLVHSGGGSDLQEIGRKGAATKTRLRIARQALGIGSARTADPRQLSRIRAQAKAEEIASALLAPLDDTDLSALAQQRSAVTILDALFPQQQVQVTVEMPADEAGVQSLTWGEMQQLAAQLLGDNGVTPELDPA